MRRSYVPLLVLVAISAVVVFRNANSGVDQTKLLPTAATNPPSSDDGVATKDPPGTIDGSSTPELIPDTTAYSLFFKSIARHNSAGGSKEFDSYMQRVSLQGINAEALLKIAQEYQDALKPLDQEVTALSASRGQQPDADAQLKEVKRQREVLLEGKIALLTDRLGQNGAERIRQYVNEFVKPQIKIFPERSRGTQRH